MTGPAPLTQRLLLVGLDGADGAIAKGLVAAGHLPTFKRLFAEGSVGELAGVTPQIPALQWTTLLTGQSPLDHGVVDAVTVDDDTVVATGSHHRRDPALWTLTSHGGWPTLALNWPASYPAEPLRGVAVADVAPQWATLPALAPGAVAPASWRDALAPLVVTPEELLATPGALTPFVPQLAQLDAAAQGPLAKALAQALAATTTVHAMATTLLVRETWSVAAIRYALLAALSRQFLPYHPPAMAELAPETSALLRHVVTTGYAFVDAMLSALLAIAGPDTTAVVVSNHGYHSGDARPDPVQFPPHNHPGHWQRKGGLLACHGPGIRPGTPFGAHTLDVLPTVLALLALPASQDLPGRVLTDVIALGLISRTLPQINTLVVGFGLNAMLTLAVMTASIGAVAWTFRGPLAAWVDRLVATLTPA